MCQTNKHLSKSPICKPILLSIRMDNILYTVNVSYRPPNVDNHDHFMIVSGNMLSWLQTYKSDNKIILPDFNCYSKHPVLPHKPLDSTATELFEGFGFTQLIGIPTCHSKYFLDLVFVKNQDYLTTHGTLPKLADHDGTLVSFHSTTQKESPLRRTICESKKNKWRGFTKIY